MSRITGIEEIDRIANKYVSKQISEFERNKNALIDAFTEYYGEKHRSLITDRINNAKYYPFISNSTASLIDDNLYAVVKDLFNKMKQLFNIRLVMAFPDFSNFMDFCSLNEEEQIKELSYIFSCNSDKSRELINYINDNIGIDHRLFDDFVTLYNFYNTYIDYAEIYSNNIDLDVYDHGFDEISSYPCLGLQYESVVFDGKGYKITPNILTSIFTNEHVLIHELNHAIVSTPIALVKDKHNEGIVEKGGLFIHGTINGKKEEDIEEIINDIAASEILDIFHKLGGRINTPMLNDTYKEWEILKNANLKFYEKYKDVIKEARITDNKNLLFRYIAKDKYNEYVSLLNQLLKNNGNVNTDISDMMQQLVDMMDREYVDIDIDGFIEELRSQGKEVILLNHEVSRENGDIRR